MKNALSDFGESVEVAVSHFNRQSNELMIPNDTDLFPVNFFPFSSVRSFKKTLNEIGESVRLAVTTIRQSYGQMYPRAAELFPENFRFANLIDQLPYVNCTCCFLYWDRQNLMSSFSFRLVSGVPFV